MINDSQTTSTRPYLIRALHEWCVDNGLTPYVTVHVDKFVQVPREFVKDSEIVLNIGFDATSGLKLGNDYMEFKARFGGVSRDIFVPVDNVLAIFARENGQGMAFPRVEHQEPEPLADDRPTETAPGKLATVPVGKSDDATARLGPSTGSAKPVTRPSLTRIK